MARLFIAVDLPSDVTQALAALQPRVLAGVRLTAAEQVPAVAITDFGLYSSAFIAGVPVYRRERFFPLICPDPEPGD